MGTKSPRRVQLVLKMSPVTELSDRDKGLVCTFPDIFENGDFFSYSKKYASTRSVFESFSPVNTKTLERWKGDSIPYRACAV